MMAGFGWGESQRRFQELLDVVMLQSGGFMSLTYVQNITITKL